MGGLRPIYLQLPEELSIDPLYELTYWRVNVTTVSDFQSVVNADDNLRLSKSKSELQSAIKYCECFFLPLNPKVLLDLVVNQKTRMSTQ